VSADLVLKVTLLDTKPPVWRRIRVPAKLTLARLHRVLQVSMGWLDCHLHQFEQGGVHYGPRDPEEVTPSRPEARTLVSSLLRRPKDRLRYDYDFGDDWRHDVLLEKVVEHDTSSPVVECLAGRRSCPPEDCGGPWGYANLLGILADPSHPEHEESIEWCGPCFRSEEFDLPQVNADLRTISRRWKAV
jgi:hypothetical protein